MGHPLLRFILIGAAAAGALACSPGGKLSSPPLGQCAGDRDCSGGQTCNPYSLRCIDPVVVTTEGELLAHFEVVLDQDLVASGASNVLGKVLWQGREIVLNRAIPTFQDTWLGLELGRPGDVAGTREGLHVSIGFTPSSLPTGQEIPVVDPITAQGRDVGIEGWIERTYYGAPGWDGRAYEADVWGVVDVAVLTLERLEIEPEGTVKGNIHGFLRPAGPGDRDWLGGHCLDGQGNVATDLIYDPRSPASTPACVAPAGDHGMLFALSCSLTDAPDLLDGRATATVHHGAIAVDDRAHFCSVREAGGQVELQTLGRAGGDGDGYFGLLVSFGSESLAAGTVLDLGTLDARLHTVVETEGGVEYVAPGERLEGQLSIEAFRRGDRGYFLAWIEATANDVEFQRCQGAAECGGLECRPIPGWDDQGNKSEVCGASCALGTCPSGEACATYLLGGEAMGLCAREVIEPWQHGCDEQSGKLCRAGICVDYDAGTICHPSCDTVGRCPSGQSCYAPYPERGGLCFKVIEGFGRCDQHTAADGYYCAPNECVGVGDGVQLCLAACQVSAGCGSGAVCVPVDEGASGYCFRALERRGACGTSTFESGYACATADRCTALRWSESDTYAACLQRCTSGAACGASARCDIASGESSGVCLGVLATGDVCSEARLHQGHACGSADVCVVDQVSSSSGRCRRDCTSSGSCPSGTSCRALTDGRRACLPMG